MLIIDSDDDDAAGLLRDLQGRHTRLVGVFNRAHRHLSDDVDTLACAVHSLTDIITTLYTRTIARLLSDVAAHKQEIFELSVQNLRHVRHHGTNAAAIRSLTCELRNILSLSLPSSNLSPYVIASELLDSKRRLVVVVSYIHSLLPQQT